MKKPRIFLDEVACSTLNYYLFGIVLLVGSSRRLISPVALIFVSKWGKEEGGGGGGGGG